MFSVQWGLCTLPNILRNTLVKYDLLFQTTKVTCVLSSWKCLCLFFYSLLQTRNNITTNLEKTAKNTMIINGYRFGGLVESFTPQEHTTWSISADNGKHLHWETELLPTTSTTWKSLYHCTYSSDQYASTFLLLCCRPNSFKVWQSAFHPTH